MSVRMKMPPIKERTYFVICPLDNVDNFLKACKENKCKMNDITSEPDEDGYMEYYSTEEVFPDTSPGMLLQGLRGREDMTQPEFALALGISRRKLSELENNKRPLDDALLAKIEERFDICKEVFLDEIQKFEKRKAK